MSKLNVSENTALEIDTFSVKDRTKSFLIVKLGIKKEFLKDLGYLGVGI